MFFKRSIAYTTSWIHTFILSVILASILVFVLIFLQPFDTYTTNIPNKNLKLIGYSFCIIAPLLIIHIIENFWYKFRNHKWNVFQEFIILLTGFLLISLISYFYNTILVNGFEIELHDILNWTLSFSAPFAPIFIPIWAYLRYRFSKVEINTSDSERKTEISIIGSNSNEQIKFLLKDFIMAQAQSNYVDLYFLSENVLKKQVIRSTLSKVINEIPNGQQVHRSFLVNPSFINSISGNTRKGTIRLNHIVDDIPISPKHFLGVKKYLQNRP